MMKISLRSVIKNDWDYILSLRNNQSFTQYFYEQHEISRDEHYAYLSRQESNPNFHNWIILKDSKDIGYIRILDGDVSIILDAKYHGCGIGTQAIKLLEEKAKSLGIKKLIGKMMVENKKSEMIFLNNDFKLKMYWYEKNLD